MSNDFYNVSGAPASGSPGSSATMRAEFGSIAQAFDKLPTLTGQANKLVLVNSTGTGLTVGTVLPAGDIVGTTETQTLTNKTITFADNTLTGVAPLASPALSGTPTAPTAAAGTNTTQIATTAHVFAERTNTATLTNKTITFADNTLTGVAPLNSPAFTGDPTAPTQVAGNNTTRLATTAFTTTAITNERTATATLTNKTLTSPTINTATISGGTINNASVGATTRSTGAFTTLTSNGATTFTAGTASTSTTTGTAVVTGGLGVSGRINAANFDGIIGANTAAAGTFTNLAYTGTLTGGTGVINIGSGQVYKDASGNVGIGITNPSSVLHLNRAGSTETAVKFTNGGGASSGFVVGANSTGAGLVYHIDNQPILFATNNAERMRIDSSGNVGIGTSSPSQKLQVVDSGTGANSVLIQSAQTGTTPRSNIILRIQSNATGRDASMQFSDNVANATEIGMVSGAQYFATGGSERMRIDSSGNVGIGTSSPSSRLNVRGTNCIVSSQGTSGYGAFYAIGAGTDQAFLFMGNASGENGRISSQNGGDLLFSNGNGSVAERMRLTPDGNLLVGTTGAYTGRLNVNNSSGGSGLSVAAFRDTASNGQQIRFQNSSATQVGSISNDATTTFYNTTSDYRLKENIEPMVGALETVAQLKPVTYNWKVDGSDGQGFIAHELQAVVPECVTGEKDAVDKDGKPVYQGIDTSFLVATLTAAIQELKAELDVVKAELNTLKGN